MTIRFFWVLWFGGMAAMWLVMVHDLITAIQCAVLTIPATIYLICVERREQRIDRAN